MLWKIVNKTENQVRKSDTKLHIDYDLNYGSYISTLLNKYGGSSKNLKHRITMQSRNPISGYIPRQIASRDLKRYVYT